MKPTQKTTLLVFGGALAAAFVVAGILAFVLQSGRPPVEVSSAPASPASRSVASAAPSYVPSAARTSTPTPLPDEMRAMWISYLEWEQMDLSTEASLRAAIGPMFDNCAQLGLNTVIVSVRPFCDALYPSDFFPWSHLVSGQQGTDPGYDPLAVLVEEAHARNLRIEAWINPYRVVGAENGPETLSADNPAQQNPELVVEAAGTWLNPGLPEVRRLVADGVREIVQNYPVDGIHFDDYFYPDFTAEQTEEGLNERFDEEIYAQKGGDLAKADWRRANVDAMVQLAREAAKSAGEGVSFGISPQGNNANNYNGQYSDVAKWMAEGGYVDYVMPQLYWGFGYRTENGADTYAFETVAQSWAALPRNESVRLYAGLGAYRIGVGDGGAGDQAEWSSGHNLADMVAALRAIPGFSGFALFRYEFLYWSAQPTAGAEAAALEQLLNPPPQPGGPSASLEPEASSLAAPGHEAQSASAAASQT